MKCLIFLTLTGILFVAVGQRKYANSSVLSAGDWLKISVEVSGIYKFTANDLKLAGFSGVVSSAQIRLFGNGGMVLPESNADPIIDDLQENAIEMYQAEPNNHMYIKTIYWKLEIVSCVLVCRNRTWFREHIGQLEAIWKIIETERISGYEHRAPKKRVKAEEVAPKTLSTGCLLKVIKKDAC